MTLTTPRSGSSAAFMCSRPSMAANVGRVRASHKGAVIRVRSLQPASAHEMTGEPTLLPLQLDRKFAIGDTPGQTLGIAGSGILAISRNQLAESRKQANLRHEVAVDSLEAGVGPGLV